VFPRIWEYGAAKPEFAARKNGGAARHGNNTASPTPLAFAACWLPSISQGSSFRDLEGANAAKAF